MLHTEQAKADPSTNSGMSEAWRKFDFHALLYEASAPQRRPVAFGAFGSWWPVLQLLFTEAGALLACGGGASGERCLWAVIGRQASELRPWEDFVGADTTPLLTATLMLGWLAQEQVVFCEDWEDEESGEIRCACGPPVPSDGSISEMQSGRLLPAAPAAARRLLQLLTELILAGEPSNVQKLYMGLMANEDWQVLYSCALQPAPGQGDTRRYLVLDRGDLELPPRARHRLASAQ
ncbi:unnamed protein product, partial [Polarella glacialis]